ncbi:MAG: hypothetical protein AAGU11_21990 [Syntrophobacteraceae bacterium]
MRKANIVSFKKHVKRYLEIVQSGEVVRLYRNGRPVAEMVPILKSDPVQELEPAGGLSFSGLFSMEIEKDKDRAK